LGGFGFWHSILINNFLETINLSILQANILNFFILIKRFLIHFYKALENFLHLENHYIQMVYNIKFFYQKIVKSPANYQPLRQTSRKLMQVNQTPLM